MRHFLTAAAIAAALVPMMALAKPMTFADALSDAHLRAPALRARALSVAAAQSSADAAGRLPDPKASVAIESFPISGPLAFKPNQDNFTWGRLGLSQDIPSLSKRRAQRSRARTDIAEAQAENSVTLRNVEVNAAGAWVTLAYAERKLSALDKVAAKLGRYVAATPSVITSGKARPAQVLAGRQALAILADRRAERIAEIGRAKAGLTRWTGDADPQIEGEVPDIALDTTRLRAGLDDHPSVAVADAQMSQADADLALARAGKRPDFGVDLSYEHRDPRFGDYLSAGVTVSLPFFAKHRQDPMIAAATAKASAARADQEATRQALAAELEASLADHVMHHEQWMRARDTLQPLAEERVALETASYSAGRATLTDVVDANVALADAVLTTIDREAIVASDAVRIKLTYQSSGGSAEQ